ncbi:hypothetical protein E8P82_05165 [Arthrobacter echini]|uniref:Uncharacterized protein n=1 Tax=Arthrobacter echini TaxID=1529066 RepID=A0A4S5E7A5_9MICC|nr:hypothetical protein [Arthrobacter echini]THJ67487.1 hypothetical protein E8P82_05165 [Arthrobacter echini]
MTDTLREPVPGGRRDRRRRQGGATTTAPDPAVLAQQQALAARAADLAARAQRARESPSRPAVAFEDPTTTHNLAALASPEFLLRTGGTESPAGTAADASAPVTPASSGSTATEPSQPTSGNATAPFRSEDDARPVEARSAFGLEPLDAVTAGLGRLRRVRYLLFSLAAVGAAALGTVVVMIVSSLNG